jgi:uncharacterized membrane protein YeaQ/YmgE (transglycosylase-associated protein family)
MCAPLWIPRHADASTATNVWSFVVAVIGTVILLARYHAVLA